MDLSVKLNSQMSSKDDEYNIMCRLKEGSQKFKKPAPRAENQESLETLVDDLIYSISKNKGIMMSIIKPPKEQIVTYTDTHIEDVLKDINTKVDQQEELPIDTSEVEQLPWETGLSISPKVLRENSEMRIISTKGIDSVIAALSVDDEESKSLVGYCQVLKHELSSIKNDNLDQNLTTGLDKLSSLIKSLKAFPEIEGNTLLDQVNEYGNRVSKYKKELTSASKVYSEEEKQKYEALVRDGEMLVEIVGESIQHLESLKSSNNFFKRVSSESDILQLLKSWKQEEIKRNEAFSKDKDSLLTTQRNVHDCYNQLAEDVTKEISEHQNRYKESLSQQRAIKAMLKILLKRYEECKIREKTEAHLEAIKMKKKEEIKRVEIDVDTQIVSHLESLSDSITYSAFAQKSYQATTDVVERVLQQLDKKIAEKEEKYNSLMSTSIQSKSMILGERIKILEDEISKKNKVIAYQINSLNRIPDEIVFYSENNDFDSVERLGKEKLRLENKLETDKQDLQRLETLLENIKKEKDIICA